MSAVFADTFYWIAITNIDDFAHGRAKSLIRSVAPRMLVTTEEVLTEYLNYFSAWGPHFRRKALTNVQHILSSYSVEVLPQTAASFAAGLALYSARPDKNYSLTDCISMQTMRRAGIAEALTNDSHFEQEGFRALFRDS